MTLHRIGRNAAVIALLGNATYGLSAIETLVDDLESRITAARAGYLDNINNANLATIADISSLDATEIARLLTIQTETDKKWTDKDDAVISQANPVSGTKYVVLATVADVFVKSISFETTGGTVQLIEVHVTIDGHQERYYIDNPVSGSTYEAALTANSAQNSQYGATHGSYTIYKSQITRGHSVLVEAEVTWTGQPSPLECRVKYMALE